MKHEVGKLFSFEELHSDFKSQGLVETKQQTEASLIKLCGMGLYEKQVMDNNNETLYRKMKDFD